MINSRKALVSRIGRESSTEAIKLPNIFVQAMFYQTLIYEKQIEQKSEHWPVVEAGEKRSVHTLEFVLADIDESGGMDHVRREIIYHIAEIISLFSLWIMLSEWIKTKCNDSSNHKCLCSVWSIAVQNVAAVNVEGKISLRGCLD